MTSSVTATFVFTDLVDSTAIGARLGPEAAEGLRQTHFRLLRGAITASGGTEVKNLGDGLMVTYSSPSRALAGAVGMQQAIEHHNRSAAEPLGVRIGMSAGEAVEEDGDYFGDPVIEAARLCATAAGGQILAADLVRLMVGRHATQTFVTVGPRELKGLPEPVDTVEVLWEPDAAAGSVPLPGRLVGAASDALFGFFGRASELAAFEEARKLAETTKRCQVVFLAGEAGIGKTALAAQVARSAHIEGAIVLFGHADEDLGVAYQPWIEALSTLVRHGDEHHVDTLPSAQRAALGRLLPLVTGDGSRVTDPDTERLLLFEGTLELLAAASNDASILLILDDLHWADAATLQLLRYVIASSASMDVTIVVTYRDTDLTRGDPLNKLLSDLHRESNVARLPITGLDDRELVDLMAAAAGHELDDNGVGLAHALRRETDGNPFFTAEMLRHLFESGGIVLGDDGHWALAGELEDLGLPNSVRDVVGRRVERLGGEALRVLRLAAVIGREFDLSELARLADVEDDPLLDLMDAAVAAAVLVESDTADRYRFAHALVQHSLYDELSPTRRQRAHQRMAELLESATMGDDAATIAELARHWVAATRPADLDKAIGYVRRAGDAARDALAPDDAIRWYRQALDLLDRQPQPDLGRRSALLAALGTAERLAGNPEFRATLLDAAALAEQLDDTDLIVQAALGFGWTVATFGDEDAKRVASAALERVPSEPTPVRARLLATLAMAHDSALEWRAARQLTLEAVEVARQTEDDATFLEVIDAIHMSYATPDRLAESREELERAVSLADRLGDPVLRANTRFDLLGARYQQCDAAGARQLFDEMEDITERLGLPHLRWRLELAAVGRLLLAGHADRAELANEQALQLGGEAGVTDAPGVFGGMLFLIRQHQGRLDEIAGFYLDVARDNPSIASLRSAVPKLLFELGRADEGRARLAAEAATNFEFPYDNTWLDGMFNFLEAAATSDNRDAARTLVDRVAPYATHVDAPAAAIVKGAIARPLARAATVLGEYENAQAWFAIAHDIHTRLEAPFWLSTGQLDHADLCFARRADGDIERARQLATIAAATAAEYGCAGLTRRAEALLATL